jgi:hypothetical protein
VLADGRLGVHQDAPSSDAGRFVHPCLALMAPPYASEFGVDRLPEGERKR